MAKCGTRATLPEIVTHVISFSCTVSSIQGGITVWGHSASHLQASVRTANMNAPFQTGSVPLTGSHGLTDNRVLRHALALGLLFASVAAFPGSLSAQQRHGDVNGDGVVSALDAQAILTAVVGLPLPAGFVVANGDSNCDAASGALDAQIVLSFVIGLPVTQYCVGQAFGPGSIRIAVAPRDTSLLINRGIKLVATLTDSTGFGPLDRPMSWATSNQDIVKIDSAKKDSVWVSANAQAGDATVTVSADGSMASRIIKVFTSYLGIIIQPQRGDTLQQLNGSRTFYVRGRDSVGTLTDSPTAYWTVTDTNIATVPPTASNSGVVTAKSSGTTWLHAVLSTSPTVKDSVPLTVALPALASCTGTGGTLHPAATYTTPQVWTPATNPHYVTGTLNFNGGSRLTIEPGTLVCASYGAQLYFHPGSRLSAVGTATQPIVITPTTQTDYWYGIYLGNNTATPPTDTSTITNTVIESPLYGIISYQDHVVTLDSVRIRRFYYNGVQLYAPGSRFIRSVVDSGRVDYTGTAVSLYRGAIEESVIRLGSTEYGIALNDSGAVRSVSITGGRQGISSAASRARLNDVTVSGTSEVALDLAGGTLHPASANVVVTGGLGGAFSGDVGNLAILFPDSVRQEGLKNNGKDTLFITGGSFRNTTLTARPDLPWVVTSEIQVDSLARLEIRPGTIMKFANGGLRVRNSGRLAARGTAALPIAFRPVAQNTFYGLVFENPPLPGGTVPPPASVDTSYLTNVQVDSASGNCGMLSCGAISTYDRHVVIIDSTIVRLSQYYGGITLAAPGSRISRSRIDTTGNPTSGYAALTLGNKTLAETVTIERSGSDGLWINGDSVNIRGMVVRNSVGVGIRADGGRLLGDSAGVTLTGNAYAFLGYIDNFAVLARDSVAQLNMLGNDQDLAVIIGRSDRRFTGRPGRLDTLKVIPQLPWQVQNDAYVDTLARLVPSPGARVGFSSGYLIFSRGGRLISRGTTAAPIVFEKQSATSGGFTGIQFQNAGGAGLDTSYIVNTHVRTIESCLGATLGCATLATHDRHVLIVDSSTVSQATYTAVSLAAPGSRISRSLIDVAGQTSSYPALDLGRATLAESTTVQNARGTGVQVSGSITAVADTIRLRALNILNSGGVALQAEGGRIVGDSASVTTSGNAYAFRGYIDNFAVLARDSLSQLQLLGNTTNRVDIVGRSDRPFIGRVGRDTVKVIPQLQWLLTGDVHFDSLARLVPSPGARVGVWGGSLHFRAGGRLHSRGTASLPVVFEKYSPTAGTFNGMQFVNGPGTTVDTSYLINTQVRTVESCQGGVLGCASLAPGDRHVLIVDSSTVSQTTYTGVSLGAPGSRISRSLIDVAGQPTSYPALELGRATLAESTTVQNARGTGVLVSGSITTVTDTIRLRALTILNSAGVALHAEGGRIVGDSGSVTATGNAYPFRGYVDNFAVLARDSIAQLNFLGNTDNRAEVVGRSDRPFIGRVGRDTLKVIPQLPWLAINDLYIDSLGRLKPSPGARIGFWSSSLHFRGGGRLISRGTSAAPVVLEKYSATSGQFNGIQFLNGPGATVDTSVLVNTQVRTIESCQGGALACAALAPQDRHVLIVDSSTVRGATYTAVSLGAAGSRISRSLIDTAGQPNSYAALELGRATLAETTTVRFARGTGVLISGSITVASDTIRLRGLTILNSAGAGLHAEGGRVLGDSGTVIASGNAYPFYGYIDNFAALVRDSVEQLNFLGNTDDVAYVIGRSDRPLRGDAVVYAPPAMPFTLLAIPQLRIEFRGQTYIDTLARFEPRPGSRLTFENGGMIFQRGGTLLAQGTAQDSIRFVPARTGVNFYGLLLSNPGPYSDPLQTIQPVAVSTIAFVRVDSSSGQSGGFFGCCAAVNTENRHQLSVTDSRVRRSINGAIYLSAAGSSITRVRVDTTGSPTTSYAAIGLNENTSATDLVVQRSGQIGIYIDGNPVTLTNVSVLQSLSNGIEIANNAVAPAGSQGLVLSDFRVDGAGGVGVSIGALGVQISSCQVLNGLSHGLATTTSLTGVVITGCNITNNTGNGVNNANATAPPNTFTIDANNNYWGSVAGPLVVNGGDGISVNVDAALFATIGLDLSPFVQADSGPTGPAAPAPAMPRVQVRGERRFRLRRRKAVLT